MRPSRWLLSVPLVVSLGCAPSLRQLESTTPADLTDLRAQYIQVHPDSPYLTHVLSGEVVKGMDYLGVIAAWGRPETRTSDGLGRELWFYVDADEDSGNSSEFELVFFDGTLARWTSRAQSGGSVAVRSSDQVTSIAVRADPPAGKRTPQY